MTENYVRAEQLAALDRNDFLLIDLLPEDHYRQRHIPGACNACVFEVSFVDQVGKLVPDKTSRIIVYGSSRRSHDGRVAIDKLHRAGYSQVALLEGGLAAWMEAGYAVAGGAADLAEVPSSVVSPTDGHYQLDPTISTIEWTGRNQGNRHFGTVKFSSGSLRITDGTLQGELTVDMDSICNINLAGDPLQPVLLAHLKSDDFFFVSEFPTAVYRITAGRVFEDAYLTSVNCNLEGDLTLRGTTAPLVIDATLTEGSARALNLEAHFDLDRTRWNVLYGSARYFEHLGMHAVFDAISIQLRCSFSYESS